MSKNRFLAHHSSLATHHFSVDPPGIEPGSPVCRTGVVPLDHEPKRKERESNPQGIAAQPFSRRPPSPGWLALPCKTKKPGIVRHLAWLKTARTPGVKPPENNRPTPRSWIASSFRDGSYDGSWRPLSNQERNQSLRVLKWTHLV